jgi:hypothetical protein
MDLVEVNETVKVVASFGLSNNVGARLRPVKMLYHGREVVFTELGMYHPTAAGKRAIHVFDLSDGASDYRLEFDAERLTWRLVSIASCH